MNERIQEFAKQAGFSFKYKTAPDELNPGHKLQDLEKFAELIVRECANLPFKATGEVTTIGEIAVSNLILKHFGVKDE